MLSNFRPISPVIALIIAFAPVITAAQLTPSITVTLVGAGEMSGDISFDYLITDVDGLAVSLLVEFDVGNGWLPAATTGNLTDILPAAYSGSIIWNSLTNAEGVDAFNAKIRITPSNDNGTGAPGESSSFHLDNNLLPSASIETPTGELTGEVEFTYTLSDPEGDILSLIGEYNVSGVWQEALSISGITAANYSGSFTWSSGNDLPGIDNTGVLFRITVSDNDEGGSSATGTFHLDNNNPPSISAFGPLAEFRGDAQINFNLFDDENDPVGIRVEYSDDNGSSWNPADITGDTSGITAGSGSLVWHSLNDLPELVGEALVRLTPSDNDIGSSASVTLQIDNIGAPEIFITTSIPSEISGDFPFNYRIIDEESDIVFLEVEFRRGTSFPWLTADISGSLSELLPDRYTGTLIWRTDSLGQLSHEDRFNAGLRIRGTDENSGDWFEIPGIHVDNNERPQLLSVSSIPDIITGKVDIPLEVDDVESDTLSIWIQFSRNGGSTWKQGTAFGESSGITRANYDPVIIWDSVIDLGFLLGAETRLRIASVDNDLSNIEETNDFVVNNFVGDFSGDSLINFDDVAGFQDTWIRQDTIRETGPVFPGTEPPELIVQKDGVIDFEDLMIFVLMFNWSYENENPTLLKETYLSFNEKDENPVLIENVNNDNSTVSLFISIPDLINVWSARLLLSYDENDLFVSDVSLTSAYSENRSNLFLKRNEAGISDIIIAPLDGLPLSDWRDKIVKITLNSISGEYTGSIGLAYDLRDESGREVEKGVFSYPLEISLPLPEDFLLHNNYPNPFNPSTVISFDLPEQREVKLVVYNLLGEEVRLLINEERKAGRQNITWNADSNSGERVSSGIYFYSLRAGNFYSVKKMILLR